MDQLRDTEKSCGVVLYIYIDTTQPEQVVSCPNLGVHVDQYLKWATHVLKDRAHLSTFKFFIFEKFSCFIVLVVFLVIVQSSELVSV